MNGFLTLCEDWYWNQMAGPAEAGLMWVTEAAVGALPIAGVVLLVNLLGRRWISAGQMGLLWCLVLVRLTFPAAPASPLSLENFIPQTIVTSADSNLRTAVDPVDSPLTLVPSVARPEYSDPVTGSRAMNSPWNSGTALCELAWLTAAIGIVVWTLGVHWHFCRQVRRTPVCHDERLLRLWESCCASARVRSRPPIVVFDGVQQPAVMGLLHPELLLPPEVLAQSDDQLRMIMLHELAHVRRWDLAINWGMVALRAMHWWNPVYWLAAARYRSLREQACDAFVIRTLHSESTRDYGELLLNLAEHAPAGATWRVLVPASLLGFCTAFFRKRALRARFKALRTAGIRRGPWHAAGVGLLIILIGLCGLTDAEPATNPSSDLTAGPLWNPSGGEWVASQQAAEEEAASGPLETRVYAIGEVVERMQRRGLDDGGARRDIEWLISQRLKRTSVVARRVQPTPAASSIEQPTHEWDGDRLIVRDTSAMHDELALLINAWEAGGLAQMSIECRIMTSHRELATAAGIEWQSLGAEPASRETPITLPNHVGGTIVHASSRVEDHIPLFVVPLNDRQVQAIVQAAQNEPRSNVMCAPKVTLFNGQQAQISDCTMRPFVVGVDERASESPMPRIKVIEEGTKMTLRTLLGADRRHIELHGVIELTSISDVRQISASTARGIRTIEAPRVTSSRFSIASPLEDGQSLLVGCLPTFDRKDCLYLLLTVRLLELDGL